MREDGLTDDEGKVMDALIEAVTAYGRREYLDGWPVKAGRE